MGVNYNQMGVNYNQMGVKIDGHITKILNSYIWLIATNKKQGYI